MFYFEARRSITSAILKCFISFLASKNQGFLLTFFEIFTITLTVDGNRCKNLQR